MALPLPSNVDYGYVMGRILLAVGDGTDVDRYPDGYPAIGTITFTASVTYVVNATALPMSSMIIPRPIVCTIDEDGYIVGPDGSRGVWLVATDDVDNNPVNWTYTVSFQLDGVSIPQYSISVPKSATLESPLYLPSVSPVPSSPGLGVPAAEAAADRAAAAAAAAAASAQEALDLIELGIPGPVGPQGPSGTITGATASTLAPGTSATVGLGGTAQARTFAFGIPRGDVGPIGPKGQQGDPGTAGVLVNSVRNPTVSNGSLAYFATYLAGTNEVGNSTAVTGAVDGPLGYVTSYARWAVTTPKTTGSSGWLANAAGNRAVLSGYAGDTVYLSVWARYTGTGTYTVIPRIYLYNAGGTSLGYLDMAPVVLASGVWTELKGKMTAAVDFVTTAWYFTSTSSNIMPAGSTLDATAAYMGPVDVPFFDATKPSTSEMTYSWSAGVGTSSSIATPALISRVSIQQLPANTTHSIDTYLTTGNFHQDANGNASVAQGYPVPLAGFLQVYVRTVFYYQFYTTYSSSARTYWRGKYSTGAWGPWKESADVSQLTPAGVGLGNVNNTSDLNKPVSTAVAARLTPLETRPVIVTATYTAGAWPTRPTPAPGGLVMWVGNPGGAAPPGMLTGDIWTQDAIDSDGVWVTSTAALTGTGGNPTLGTGGSSVGRYTRIGNTIIFRFLITFGTAGVTAGDGTYVVMLPTGPMDLILGSTSPIGSFSLLDKSSSNRLWGVITPNSTGTGLVMRAYPTGIPAQAGGSANVGSAYPWAWTNEDIIEGYVTYNLAA